MKKHIILLAALCWMGSLQASVTLTLGGTPYVMDTVNTFKAGPGSQYIALQLHRASDGKNPQEVFIMKVDTKNPYISIESVMGKDLRVGLERPSAMAERKTTDTKIYFTGTNGDFYANSAPIGPTICENEYVNTANEKNFQCAAVGEDSRGLLSYRAMFNSVVIIGTDTFPITRTNAQRDQDELIFYNHFEGSTTATNGYGTELLCRLPEGETWHTTGTFHPIVEAKEYHVGSMVMPAGKFVLSGHGKAETFLGAAAVGDTLTMLFSLDLFNTDEVETHHGAMVRCSSGADNYKMPIHDGQVEQEERFIWNETHPRTGFGYTQNNDTAIFCVWDGRNSKRSVGATTKMLGELMQYFGAYNVLNLDGGGSSCLYIRHFGPMNNGSDGNERTVSDGLFAVANIPQADNTYTELIPRNKVQLVAKYGVVTPHCFGYNQYGLMLSPEVEGLTLSCDPEVGYVNEKNQLVALQSGTLKVQKDNAITMMQIEVADSPISLRLDSVVLGKGTQYNAQIQAEAGGEMMEAYAPAFTWGSMNEQVAMVDKGVITGVSTGRTQVWCSVGPFADTLTVVVEVPQAECVEMKGYEVDSTMQFSSTRNINITLPMDVRFYGCPDSVLVTIQTNAPISYLEAQLQANNADKGVTRKMSEAVPKDADFTYRIALADMLDVTDIAIYPVHMTQLKWALKDPKKNTPYRMQLKKIEAKYSQWSDETGLFNGEWRMENGEWHKVMHHGRVVIDNGARRYGIAGKLEN